MYKAVSLRWICLATMGQLMSPQTPENGGDEPDYDPAIYGEDPEPVPPHNAPTIPSGAAMERMLRSACARRKLDVAKALAITPDLQRILGELVARGDAYLDEFSVSEAITIAIQRGHELKLD